MNKDEFRLRFGEKIRVNVGWKRYAEDDVRIIERKLALPDDLNVLWTPWYPGGSSHHLSGPDAEPLSVLGAASDLTLIGSHAEGVKTCLEKLGDGAVEAPAIALPRGRYLLLDQNHHLTALAVRMRPVALSLFIIDAPAHARLLTDIRAFD